MSTYRVYPYRIAFAVEADGMLDREVYSTMDDALDAIDEYTGGYVVGVTWGGETLTVPARVADTRAMLTLWLSYLGHRTLDDLANHVDMRTEHIVRCISFLGTQAPAEPFLGLLGRAAAPSDHEPG